MSEETNPGRDWSEADLDLVTGDYLVMLGKELAGETADREKHQRALRFVTGRSGGAIVFKQCEISAALTLVGLPILADFHVRWGLADELLDAVDRQLSARPALIQAAMRPVSLFASQGTALPLEGPPPVFADEQVEPGPRAVGLVAKFDPAARDQADRFLNETGLACVIALEQHRLRQHGRADLADQVRVVASEAPRIASFAPDGEPLRIAAKTTTGGAATPFRLTDEEDALWASDPGFRIRRIHDLGRDARYFTLRP